MRPILKISGTAALFSAPILLAFGLVTAVIPNPYFTRMTPVNGLDYIFLMLTSVLLGTYLSFHRYQLNRRSMGCDMRAYTGGLAGFLGFGCVACNKLLVLLLGLTAVWTYVEPYRPFIGTAGILLAGHAVHRKGKELFGGKHGRGGH